MCVVFSGLQFSWVSMHLRGVCASVDEQDGPTHQPVETVSGLRVFPNLDVLRPADPEETAAAYAAGIDRKDGPTALILTRQNVRTLKEIPVRRITGLIFIEEVMESFGKW